jgi:Lrp/AsnC family transcriptional regulator, leucine-responsive regulatory protein
MDELDIDILRLLKENAKIPASEISNHINLSVSAVGERLKKLEKSGVIKQYTTILNPNVLKKDLTALMFISLERPQVSEEFLKYVQLEEEIMDCYYLAGDYDYMIKIATENTRSLERLLNRIKSISGIIKTNTIVVLATEKESYSVPI